MMHWVLEILLGLPHGFLGREGDFFIQFAPQWPGQNVVGASTCNLLLAAVGVMLIFYVYQRDGHSQRMRVVLGIVRGLLLAMVLLLLNRPVLTLGQSRTEPSVLAVMIDDSLSMRVNDAANGGTRIGFTTAF